MKRNEIRLYTPIEVYDDLVQQLDRGRGKTIKLDRDAVTKILIDHGRLCAKLDDLGGPDE